MISALLEISFLIQDSPRLAGRGRTGSNIHTRDRQVFVYNTALVYVRACHLVQVNQETHSCQHSGHI